MGAEVSDLGQYSLDGPIDDNIWVVKQGVSDDDSLITVFTDESNDREKRQLFQRNIKLLRSIRHPCVLHYLSSGEVSSGSYLVTERVTPLRQVIDTLDPVEVCAGLFDVLQGLSFLHERAGISHNNICMDCLYITNSGLWKIGGFEFACKFSDGTPEFLSSGKKVI
ncbi:hypothetical protein KUTeg_021710 [Tegillarca granosa]|uniref:Protein kinase domain-containing protein n=1 Tax=Tegillarca granosa TaxID=220873 RepID=A0ABQ9E8T0_TEGGR|nr:hypothetical protein KUTeg_021710 [Tegillarca granosa]